MSLAPKKIEDVFTAALERSSPTDRAYGAACALALCVSEARKDAALSGPKQEELAKQYADQAMAYLRLAVEKGYRNAPWMRQDTDLDPIRDRPEFKKLIADLEQPVTPKLEPAPPPRPGK